MTGWGQDYHSILGLHTVRITETAVQNTVVDGIRPYRIPSVHLPLRLLDGTAQVPRRPSDGERDNTAPKKVR